MVNYQKIAIGITIIVTIIAIIAVLSYLLIKNSKEKYTAYTGNVNNEENENETVYTGKVNHPVYRAKVNSKENYTVYTGKVNNELTNYIITNSQGLNFSTNYHGTGTDSNIYNPENQPGPSFWNPNNAFIGNDGELHLRYIQNAVHDSKSWASAEAQLLSPLNYGDYFYTVQFVSDGGAGAYSENNDWNTTFGAYTFAKAGLTQAGMCQNYCYESADNPNACHELDMIEWGKSRDPKNVGIAQWGTQPWFADASCNFNTKNLDRSAWNFKQADWDAIGAANNNITFRMNWTPTNLEFWAAPGDYGTQPWNKGFQDNVKWHFKYSGDPRNIPTVDGKTYLMFNLWAPGVLIGNNQKIGPSDGKPKEVIIKNIAVPPSPVPPPQPSTDEVCKIIGQFCDLNGSLGQSLDQGFTMLCTKSIKGCWDCNGFPTTSHPFPKACIQGSTCTMENVCDYVGDMWYYLQQLRNNLSQTFTAYYNSKDAGFAPIQTVNVVVPNELQSGGTGCNSGNVLVFAQQAFATLSAISDEVGQRFTNIIAVTGCKY